MLCSYPFTNTLSPALESDGGSSGSTLSSLGEGGREGEEGMREGEGGRKGGKEKGEREGGRKERHEGGRGEVGGGGGREREQCSEEKSEHGLRLLHVQGLSLSIPSAVHDIVHVPGSCQQHRF